MSAYQLMFEITSSTLVDITKRTSSSFEEANNGLVIRTVTLAVGSLLFGYAFERINRQFGVAVAVMVMAVNTMLTPMATSSNLFQVAMLINGLSASAMEVASTPWLLEMWQSSAIRYLQMVNFAGSMANAGIPLVAAPFLSNEQLNATTNATNMQKSTEENDYRLFIPYGIAASTGFTVSIFMLALYYLQPYESRERIDEMSREVSSVPVSDTNSDTSSCESTENMTNCAYYMAKSNSYYSHTVTILGCFVMSLYSGLDSTSTTLIPEYLTNLDIGITAETAAQMLSDMSFSVGIFNVLAIFFSKYFRPGSIMSFGLSFSLIGYIILISSVNHSVALIGPSFICIGAGTALFTPSAYTFMEERVSVTNRISGFISFGGKAIMILNTIVIGKAVKKHPETYTYISVALLSLCTLCLTGLLLNELLIQKRLALLLKVQRRAPRRPWWHAMPQNEKSALCKSSGANLLTHISGRRLSRDFVDK